LAPLCGYDGAEVDNQQNQSLRAAFDEALTRLRRLNRRHVAAFVAAGLVADAAIVLGGLWWFGVVGADSAEAGRATPQSCTSEEMAVDDQTPCPDSPRERGAGAALRVTENAAVTARAITLLQARCRETFERPILEQCAEVPVIDDVMPAVSLRIRVEALLRLASYGRLETEASRLIDHGDTYGYMARGLARHAGEDYARASADYREAIKYYPDDPMLLDNLARAEVSAPMR
jgi:hypothetical protein